MKVLMTTDNIGGVWTYSLDLAKGLQNYGIEIVLAVIGNPLSEQQIEELGDIHYYFGAFKQEWMPDPWEDVEQAGQWLLGIKQLVQPDIVHLNSFSFGSLSWDVPVIITMHSCVQSWWKAVKKEELPAEWEHYKNQVESGIRSADMVVAPSNTMLEMAIKDYGPIKSHKVIYNGRNENDFSIGPKVKFTFSMGRLWDEAKNIRSVVKAAAKIDYPMFIAGDKDSVNMDDLPENVYFLGHLSGSETAKWLSRASVYFLPVSYEPFGYTFLEAALSGCALVGGDIASLRELWGDTMLYVDPEDIDHMAAAVNDLLQDEDRLTRLAQKAHRRALKRYSLESMILEYVSLYEKIHERKTSGNWQLATSNK